MNFQVLEEVYQEYKDVVSFVYVYSREAHPEEDPFLEGFESSDLGWHHPYTRTTSMPQRAERARWMKSDLEPDAEMPMMIDYIDTPLGSRDAIKQFYDGAGFYSGYVIDCDATILAEVPWAWHGPGAEWWSLPLAEADQLRAFLDDYLADPPPCYDPPSAPDDEPGPPPERDSEPTILIVDDDGGDPYEGYFKVPLRSQKNHVQVWDVHAAGSPALSLLQDFGVVVWLTGDMSEDTLTAEDQDNLAAYLDQGGGLFISGQNIGQDIGDTAFYRDYLHATLLVEDMDIHSLIGIDIFEDTDVALVGFDGAGNQTSPSGIEPREGAHGVFRYQTGGEPPWAGLRWGGHYRVVYFAFGMEGIGNLGAAAHRYTITDRLVTWLEAGSCPGDINDDKLVDNADYVLFEANLDGPVPMTAPPGEDRDFLEFLLSDLDQDGDVDVVDFGEFQEHFGAVCE
jgi:hypothetical protein